MSCYWKHFFPTGSKNEQPVSYFCGGLYRGLWLVAIPDSNHSWWWRAREVLRRCEHQTLRAAFGQAVIHSITFTACPTCHISFSTKQLTERGAPSKQSSSFLTWWKRYIYITNNNNPLLSVTTRIKLKNFYIFKIFLFLIHFNRKSRSLTSDIACKK